MSPLWSDKALAQAALANAVARGLVDADDSVRSPAHHGRSGVSAMSPLWSDKALAEAAWANAVARGLVDEDRAADREKESGVERVRRIARPRLHSWAL